MATALRSMIASLCTTDNRLYLCDTCFLFLLIFLCKCTFLTVYKLYLKNCKMYSHLMILNERVYCLRSDHSLLKTSLQSFQWREELFSHHDSCGHSVSRNCEEGGDLVSSSTKKSLNRLTIRLFTLDHRCIMLSLVCELF